MMDLECNPSVLRKWIETEIANYNPKQDRTHAVGRPLPDSFFEEGLKSFKKALVTPYLINVTTKGDSQRPDEVSDKTEMWVLAKDERYAVGYSSLAQECALMYEKKRPIWHFPMG